MAETDRILETSGALLRKTREEKKVTREMLAQLTALTMRDIERLEGDDYARLPADLYVRNFFERCALALSASPVPFLEAYERRSALLRIRKTPSRKFLENKPIVTPRILFGFLAFFLSTSMGFYFWYQLNFLLAPPFLIVISPKGDIMTQESELEIAGRTQRESHVFINDQETPVDAQGKFHGTLMLRDGMNVAEIKSVDKFEKETTVTRRIIKN